MVILCDSFDHYTTLYLFYKDWWHDFSAVTIDTSAGRRGGGCLKIESLVTGDDDPYALKAHWDDPVRTGFVGFACYISAYPPTNSTAFFGFRDSTYSLGWWTQCNFVLNTDGTMDFYRGGTLLGSTTDPLPLATFFYIEAKIKIDTVNGEFEVRVNEATVMSGTGVNTQQTDESFFDHVGFWSNQDTGWFYYVDDLYLCNDQPANYGGGNQYLNTSFLGDVDIECLYPTADSHEHNNFTPSVGGADHYTLVNETHIDESDYVSSSISSDVDHFKSLEHFVFTGHNVDRYLAIQPVASLSGVNPFAPNVALAVHNVEAKSWLSGSVTNAWPGAVGERPPTFSAGFRYYPLNFNPATEDFWKPVDDLPKFEFGVMRSSEE